MRIIMGKVHHNRAESIRRERPTGRPRRTAPPKMGHAGKKRPSGKGVFFLLGAAFLATFLIGLHEGMTTHLAAATQKAAALSAQMSYPQGGQVVAAREMNKLQAIFARSRTVSTASTARQPKNKTSSTGK